MYRMFLTLALLAAVACGKSSSTAPAEEQPAPEVAPTPAVESPLAVAKEFVSAFAPLPADYVKPSQSKALEDLGRQLYYDKRISKNHDISCNSCHDLATFGVDNQSTSPGHKGVLGGRNSPTVLNAAGHLAQFWDGRAEDVEAQAKGPVLNPVEMAMPNDKAVLAVLASIPGYVGAFKAAFPDDKKPLTYDNFGAAVGAFERRLVTPAKWDRFLGGDDAALSEAELEGFNTFMESGCAACHNGVLLGAATYQKLGVMKPWPNQEDKGRGALTNKPEDEMMFKVPSLRNIARTAPYFHDGSAADLPTAIVMMAEYQRGLTLAPEKVAEIATFLEALTGEVDAAYVAEPEPFASGKKTPKPDPS